MSVATAIPEVAEDLWTDTLQDEDVTTSLDASRYRGSRRRSGSLTRVVRIRPEEQDEETLGATGGVLLFQVGKPQRTVGAQSFVAEVRAELSQIGYAGDAITTSSPWPLRWRCPGVEVESWRGVLAIRHEYRELFSDVVELDLHTLPRSQPKIILTRRMLEANEE